MPIFRDGVEVAGTGSVTGTVDAIITGAAGDAVVDVAANIDETDVLLGTHDPAIGRTVSAAVVTDAAMSVIAGIRGLVKRSSDLSLGLFTRITGAAGTAEVDTAANIAEADVLLGTHDPAVGGTTSAAVITDANMSVIAGIRGLVKRASDATLGVMVTGTVDNGVTDAGAPVKVGGIASLVAPTLVAALQRVNAWFDQAGRLHVNQDMPLAGENIALGVIRVVTGFLNVEQEATEQANPALVSTLVASQIVRATAGRFYAVSAVNTTAVGLWVHVINNTTAVAPAAQIIETFYVPALGYAKIDLSGYNGDYCDTGLCLAGSTVPTAITSPGAVLKFYPRFF